MKKALELRFEGFFHFIDRAYLGNFCSRIFIESFKLCDTTSAFSLNEGGSSRSLRTCSTAVDFFFI